ncbi:MAG: ECF RNA polymerase sigma factor SigK [Longispora sp.]|nr:ECF RNA polymerase sigma factor SigK [Longispora sp. (in: high G+C Gram-positive bacteria)]
MEPVSADELLPLVARGDEHAFESLYDLVAAKVYGLCLRVIRDPAQAEEVAQEALLEVWRTATRYNGAQGSAMNWIFTLAHRRSVDRVRSAQASSERERRAAAITVTAPFDEVAEEVTGKLERLAVRRCMKRLTDAQYEAISLAYYGGYTYRQVADLLDMGLPAVKTRIRDGLIRLRDCLEVGQ